MKEIYLVHRDRLLSFMQYDDQGCTACLFKSLYPIPPSGPLPPIPDDFYVILDTHKFLSTLRFIHPHTNQPWILWYSTSERFPAILGLMRAVGLRKS